MPFMCSRRIPGTLTRAAASSVAGSRPAATMATKRDSSVRMHSSCSRTPASTLGAGAASASLSSSTAIRARALAAERVDEEEGEEDDDKDDEDDEDDEDDAVDAGSASEEDSSGAVASAMASAARAVIEKAG